MIYATIKEKKKDLSNNIKSELFLKPTTEHVATTRIYGDNVGKSINSLENQIDAFYTNPNLSSNIRNHSIRLLMRKLNSLNTFKKRKLGGLYRISRPPTNPQNFTPKTVSKVKKKRKKVNHNHNHNFKNYNDDFLTDMNNFLFEPVNTDTGTEVISPKKKHNTRQKAKKKKDSKISPWNPPKR